eukprot:UN29945
MGSKILDPEESSIVTNDRDRLGTHNLSRNGSAIGSLNSGTLSRGGSTIGSLHSGDSGLQLKDLNKGFSTASSGEEQEDEDEPLPFPTNINSHPGSPFSDSGKSQNINTDDEREDRERNVNKETDQSISDQTIQLLNEFNEFQIYLAPPILKSVHYESEDDHEKTPEPEPEPQPRLKITLTEAPEEAKRLPSLSQDSVVRQNSQTANSMIRTATSEFIQQETKRLPSLSYDSTTTTTSTLQTENRNVFHRIHMIHPRHHRWKHLRQQNVWHHYQ